MRKYILLIIYITGLAFTQQASNAALSLLAVKIQRSGITHLMVKANQYPKYGCCDDNNFCLSDLNLENDENAKSKPVYATDLFLLHDDIRFIVEADQFKNKSSFRSTFSRDLFKMNRVFRL